jgi:hypothetical protein
LNILRQGQRRKKKGASFELIVNLSHDPLRAAEHGGEAAALPVVRTRRRHRIRFFGSYRNVHPLIRRFDIGVVSPCVTALDIGTFPVHQIHVRHSVVVGLANADGFREHFDAVFHLLFILGSKLSNIPQCRSVARLA